MAINQELPPKYYLHYFEYLLTFVEDKYGTLLNKNEVEFLNTFRQLSEDARCLYTRIMNRKGVFFRIAKFNYAEIKNIDYAAQELLQNQFISLLNLKSKWEKFHSIFTKSELIKIAKNLDLETKGLTAAKREKVVFFIGENTDSEILIELLNQQELIVEQKYIAESLLFKFLFFGSLNFDMTEFVIRDIGNLRFEKYNQDNFIPFFNSRKEVNDKLSISLLYEEFREVREELSPEDLYSWFFSHRNIWEDLAETALPTFNRMVLRTAHLLEKGKLFRQAIEIYQLTKNPPSRERQVRLLFKLKQTEKAEELCREILNSPQNADEQYFASDFLNKLTQKSFKKSTTIFKKQGIVVEISRDFEYRVENGVLDYYLSRGYQGFRSENYLWRSTFGLLFWDIIYTEDTGAIHHPLQRIPSDMYGSNFLEKRADAFEERLKKIRRKDFFNTITQKHFEDKIGMVSYLVGWHEGLLFDVQQLREVLTGKQIASVMQEMAKNLKENTKGFPDLFVWKNKKYQFLEVKSPNDQLSSQQLFWLEFFAAQGIKANVANVKWI